MRAACDENSVTCAVGATLCTACDIVKGNVSQTTRATRTTARLGRAKSPPRQAGVRSATQGSSEASVRAIQVRRDVCDVRCDPVLVVRRRLSLDGNGCVPFRSVEHCTAAADSMCTRQMQLRTSSLWKPTNGWSETRRSARTGAGRVNRTVDHCVLYSRGCARSTRRRSTTLTRSVRAALTHGDAALCSRAWRTSVRASRWTQRTTRAASATRKR